MTQEECVKALRGSMELFLFDPSIGETSAPDSLNKTSRITYDAMEYAANFLQAHPRCGAHSFYYTFGADRCYPCRDSGTLNCECFYDEKTWAEVVYPPVLRGKEARAGDRLRT